MTIYLGAIGRERLDHAQTEIEAQKVLSRNFVGGSQFAYE
jgi:hypothetical protein